MRGGARAAEVAHRVGYTRVALTALFLVLALLFARLSWGVGLAVTVERFFYDARAYIAGPRVEKDDRLTMVVYTEATLAKSARRSPVDRRLLARALTNIDTLNPKAIGIDILVDQPLPDEDAELIAAFRGMKTPTHLAFATANTNEVNIHPAQEAFMRNLFARVGPSELRPTSILLQADDDGTMRNWPETPAELPPMMSIAVSRAETSFAGYRRSIDFLQPSFEDREVFNKLSIEVFDNPALLPLLRPQIEGRVVLIGADLPNDDRHPVPITRLEGETMAGLEVHAHLVAQALDGRRLPPIPDWTLWAAAAVVVAAGAFTGLSELRTLVAAPVALGQWAILVGLPIYLHSLHDFDTQAIPAFGWLGGWTLAALAVGSAARSVGDEQRKFAQSALGKYLPRDVAEAIIRNPEQMALSGERREIYTLFTDLEGFTKLTHATDADALAKLLNNYLDILSGIVLRHGGTLDKFVGDAVVAFWGAPLARPDDGDRAIAAAIAMGEAGRKLVGGPKGDLPLMGRTRVGLHRGEAVVGNFGGEGRIQYTALGDSMNTAARLEGANKKLLTTILVSGETLAGRDRAGFRPMGRITLRGRNTPVDVYEPGSGMTEGDVSSLAEAYARFDSGDVDALADIEALAVNHADDAALGNLVYRLKQVGPGGSYELD